MLSCGSGVAEREGLDAGDAAHREEAIGIRQNGATMTFAGLTAQAEISIFTPQMRFLKRITTLDRSGGVQWDMRDENSKALPSGVYIYHVTGKDDTGNSVKPNESKFVIIRNR